MSTLAEIVLAALGEAAGASPIEVALPVSEWTNALEREFLSLAVTSATGKATAAQEQRLASLQATLRRLKFPRTTEEIVTEYQARRTTRELADALQKYVRLRDSKTDPWASAKTNVQQPHVSQGD